MTTIAWQTPDPERLVSWLRTVLGSPPAGRAELELRLANAVIRPTRNDARLDRLVIGEDASPPQADAPILLAVGIGTVDTERYAAERGWRSRLVAPDPILGAFMAAVDDSHAPPIVLLEPNTEGRLAATLARHGEVPVALYVAMDPAAFAESRRAAATIGPVSTVVDGPFGPEWAPLGRPVWGPHMLVVAASASGIGTIHA